MYSFDKLASAQYKCVATVKMSANIGCISSIKKWFRESVSTKMDLNLEHYFYIANKYISINEYFFILLNVKNGKIDKIIW